MVFVTKDYVVVAFGQEIGVKIGVDGVAISMKRWVKGVVKDIK